MMLFVALISFLQPGLDAAAPKAVAPSVVILGDEVRRGMVERVLGDLAAAGSSNRQGNEGGLLYVGCVTAWRDNMPQTEACIRGLLQRHAVRPTVVLNTYERDAGPGTTRVSCISPGGSGRATLRRPADAANAAAMRICLDLAHQETSGPLPRLFRVRSTDRFGIEDVEHARGSATIVLRIAVDHVGYPRGMTGSCFVQGRLAETEERRSALSGRPIELSVPCGPATSPDGDRRVRMADLGEGLFARIYLDSRRTLLHIEPAPSE